MTCEHCGEAFTPKINRTEGESVPRFCSASCRRDAYTLRQLQAGKASGGYKTLDAFLNRRRRVRGNSPRLEVVSGA